MTDEAPGPLGGLIPRVMPRQRVSTRKMVLVGIVSVVACVSVACLITYKAAVLNETTGVNRSETTLKATVPVQLDQLPLDANVREWYNLAVDILTENAWGEVPPSLITFSVGLSCKEDLQDPIPESVLMHFADIHLETGWPFLKDAELLFEPAKGIASISIGYGQMSLVPPVDSIDVWDIEVRWQEAFVKAESLGGATFREEVGNRCLVSTHLAALDEHDWRIEYRDESREPYRWADFWIEVDSQTGDARRIDLPP